MNKKLESDRLFIADKDIIKEKIPEIYSMIIKEENKTGNTPPHASCLISMAKENFLNSNIRRAYCSEVCRSCSFNGMFVKNHAKTMFGSLVNKIKIVDYSFENLVIFYYHRIALESVKYEIISKIYLFNDCFEKFEKFSEYQEYMSTKLKADLRDFSHSQKMELLEELAKLIN